VLQGEKPVLMEEHEKLPTEAEQEEIADESKKQKRPSAEIRSEMKKDGCVFLFFDATPAISNKWINEWRAMEKYGFIVTTEGCMLPYKYFWKSFKKGDKIKGHIRSVHFFMNKEPNREAKVNQYGWPCDEQVSHLCHNPDCVNPMHLFIELRWQNLKRNYCGFAGSCDCGMKPSCVRTYTNPETFHQSKTIETDLSKVKVVLADLLKVHPFKVRPMTYYDVEDQKATARNTRKKREKKHREQSVKKQKKLASKQEVQ
jgi:hypothetical protein